MVVVGGIESLLAKKPMDLNLDKNSYTAMCSGANPEPN